MGCGAPLSRYNHEATCAGCAQASPAEVAEPGLTHGQGPAADAVAHVLRAWRVAHRRSQVEVAALLGMTQQNLSHLENGKRSLSLEQRRRIVEQLGISPEDVGLAPGGTRRRRAGDDLPAEVQASQAAWRSERRWLNEHRSALARLAAQLYPAELRIPRSPILAAANWQLPRPLPLDAVSLQLDESPYPTVVDGSETASEPTRPLRARGCRFDRYTAAVRHLEPPRLFESRPSYRLLDGDLSRGALGFGVAAYFDKLDTCEAVGHELAVACMADGIPRSPKVLAGRLPFRDLIGDPFDTGQRAVVPAITTLTIRLRRYPDPPSFLLHWRDPASVATAAGVYDVVPAGEFQPSSIALFDRHADFDLWRNIVREYSEELLGTPEHDGTRTAPIAYDEWPLFRGLSEGRRDGTVGAWVVGMGVDALTLAATILTVVVIDDDVFTRAFGDVVRFNDEGEIVTIGDGRHTDGVPFTQEAVSRILDVEPLASPGAACLSLAWQHRTELLGL
jgi:transcriptional regulator with XRE-family HTH domain